MTMPEGDLKATFIHAANLRITKNRFPDLPSQYSG